MGHYFFILIRRWLWLMLLAALVAIITTFFFVQNLPTSYEAQTKLLVGPGIDSPSPDLNTLRASGYLMLTYAELPTTTPFLQGLVDELELGISANELADRIDIRPNVDTQVLTVIVTYDDPLIAIKLANRIAGKLVNASPFSQQNPSDPLKDQVSEQIKMVKQSAATTEGRIKELENELNTLVASQSSAGENGSTAANNAANKLDKLESDYRLFQNTETVGQLTSQIYQELLQRASSRLEALKAELEQAKSISVQHLVLDQIALEQEHLSSLQKAEADSTRLVENKSLDDVITDAETQVEELKGQRGASVDSQNALTAAQQRLDELQKMKADREQQVLDQIGLERQRATEYQAFHVEKHGQLLDQLDQEKTSLDESQHTLALLYAQLQEASTNRVVIIEPATQVSRVGLPIWMILFLSGATGLVISFVIILAIEYLSDRIQSPEELAQLTKRPVMGVINHNTWKQRFNSGVLSGSQEFDTDMIESIRMLSTKFLVPKSSGPKSLLILPCQAGEDGSEIAANLAVVLSQAGIRTVLIDANFRQPRISKLFNLPEDSGLAEYLKGPGQIRDITYTSPNPDLSLLPAGSAAHTGFQLLASDSLVELVEQLKSQGAFVLISAPPLDYAESLLLASRFDSTLLVAFNNHTSREKIKAAVESLEVVGAHLIGSIFSNYQASTSVQYGGFKFSMDRKGLLQSDNGAPTSSRPEKEGTLGKFIS